MSTDLSSPDAPLRLQRTGAVAVLTLNRPQQLNALDVPMATAFLEAVRRIEQDGGVRAVLLCGEGRSFGAGGDLKAMHDDGPTATADRIITQLHDAVQRLAALDAPVVAALQGAIAGGSWSLALACDLAVAADDAVFTLAYGRLGASCDVNASWALPRIVGLRRAMGIALLHDRIDAAEALRLGLVNRVVPAAALRDEALALAQRLADGPTLAHGRLKRLLRASFDHDLASQLDAERDAFLAGTRTQDFHEGVDAFLHKRKAKFDGR
jgi:2-(1,2-epoxy-1,2-dihydrophenyl)acetyl-CoA isomerase